MWILEDTVQFLKEVFPDRTMQSIREIADLVEKSNPRDEYALKVDHIFNLLSDNIPAPRAAPISSVVTDNLQSQWNPSIPSTSTAGGLEDTNTDFIVFDSNESPFGNFSGNDAALNQTYDSLCNLFPEACPDFLWKFCRRKCRYLNLDEAIDELTKSGYDRILLDETTIWNRLRDALPNADPLYLEEKAKRFANLDAEDLEGALENFLTNAIEENDYPTMENYVKSQEEESSRKIYYEEFFNPQQFLEIIPDPETTFHDPNRKSPLGDPNTTEEDLTYAKVFLYNAYPHIRKRHIDLVFRRKKNRLIDCVDELNYIKKGIKVARPAEKAPLSKNVVLLQEVAYLRHRGLLRRFIKHKDETYLKVKEEARKLNLLETCSICYEDEMIPEECYFCTKGCVFCKDCVQKGAETRIGDGQITFPCFNDCDGSFADRTLQMVLPKKSFDRLIQRIQSDEIKKANVDGLETCPFCYYACVPPENSTIFECKNLECLKHSCRKCRHESHIPARCNEIEYDEDVRRRTYIENKMTEALTRTCYRCAKTFVKTNGCNKMTCVCGAMMCYLCRQPVQDYNHFQDVGPCRKFTNDGEINLARVLQEVERAKQDLGNVEIKFDPSVGIEEFFEVQ